MWIERFKRMGGWWSMQRYVLSTKGREYQSVCGKETCARETSVILSLRRNDEKVSVVKVHVPEQSLWNFTVKYMWIANYILGVMR